MRSTLVGCLLCACLSSARADVVVTVAPQGAAPNFVYRSASERDALVRDLAALLRKLGREKLPEGQSLSVELIRDWFGDRIVRLKPQPR